MTVHTMPLQGAAQAPTPPPIPALPAQPGAATGGGTAPRIAGDAAQAARDAAQAGRDAAQAGRDAADAARNAQIRDGIRQGIRDGIALPGETTTETQLPFDPEAVLRQATPIVGMTLTMVIVIFIGFPIARAFARRMDRRGDAGAVRAADLQPQILQLQESLDAMAVELERISEAQRFQAKLMSERPQALPVEQKRA